MTALRANTGLSSYARNAARRRGPKWPRGEAEAATAMAPFGQRYAYRTWLLMGFFKALPPEIEEAAIAYNLFLDRFISGTTGGAVK